MNSLSAIHPEVVQRYRTIIIKLKYKDHQNTALIYAANLLTAGEKPIIVDSNHISSGYCLPRSVDQPGRYLLHQRFGKRRSLSTILLKGSYEQRHRDVYRNKTSASASASASHIPNFSLAIFTPSIRALIFSKATSLA